MKLNLTKVTEKASVVAGKSGLVLKKHSPEILLATGIVGIIGTVVLASKATLNLEYIIEEGNDKLDDLHAGRDEYSEEEYTPMAYKQDIALTYAKTTGNVLRNYAPAITLGALSIASILASYNILNKRNVALMAAYKVSESMFEEYRQRVIEDMGEEKDFEYRYGEKKTIEKEQIVGENGRKKTIKNEVSGVDPNLLSDYARFFDDGCKGWEKDSEFNFLYLKGQQTRFNNLLQARGHVYLNEVYDALGIPRSKAGQVVGWVISKTGDNYIDFGIFDVNRLKAREFVNGYERTILLDFNVDGVIYDKM